LHVDCNHPDFIATSPFGNACVSIARTAWFVKSAGYLKNRYWQDGAAEVAVLEQPNVIAAFERVSLSESDAPHRSAAFLAGSS
jgi:hypothetical protein